MSYPKFLLLSKGFLHLIYRFFLILKRFGFTSKKIAKTLYILLGITDRYGGKISMNITAVVLDRHPSLIKDLSEKGVEFGVHGYVHTNYCTLSLKDQINDLKKAKDIFAKHQIPLDGFRAPYLCYNNDTLKAIEECGFLWSSNQVIDWEILEKDKFSMSRWKTYQKLLLEIYKPKSCGKYLSLPECNSYFVEIPISIPDDEIIVDRLQINDPEMIEKVWLKIFEETHKRGELFTLQLHHERINYYKAALESILKKAVHSQSKVWLATLKEVAEWWKERNGFKFEIIHQKDGKYRVISNCSKRAVVLVKNLTTDISKKTFFNGYKIINDRDFTIESPIKPCIGISPNAPAALQNLLKNEGFAFETSQYKEQYGLYFDNDEKIASMSALELVRLIGQSSAPLLRYWNWPDGNVSALSVTGDIDSITLWDFLFRFFEF